MIRSIWFAVVLLSSAWLYLLSTFTPAPPLGLVPLFFPLFIGIGFAAMGFRRVRVTLTFKETILLSLPMLLVILLLPLPYWIGAGVIVAGLILSVLFGGLNLQGAPLGSLVSGLILLLQAAVTPFYYILGARCHELKGLNDIAYPVLKWFGLDVSMSEGVLYIPTSQNMLAFPGLLEKFGFYPLFYILSGGILVIMLFDRRTSNILKLFGIVLGYAFIRYITLVFVYAPLDDAVIYWNAHAVALSFIPLAGLLAYLLPLRFERKVIEGVFTGGLSRRDLLYGSLFFAAAFCLIMALGFYDPGTKKAGRILIDEKHSDWEWTTRKFDTSWYGSRSTYNYYCMAQYLDHFFKVSYNFDPLTPENLEKYDILILKTPTKAYGANEIEAIVEFVAQGGGLWLIGDHTNVFGMSYYMNFIAKRFGLFFNYDSTYDLDTGRLSHYTPPKLLPHPIVQRMPPFLYATSSTLNASLGAQNSMIGYGLRTRLLSYSERGFFEKRPSSDYQFGPFLQGAAVTYGKGRVSAFTDSTCFSNFYMFIPGKPELALGNIDWLNRKNQWGFLRYICGVLFLFCLGGLFYETRKQTQAPIRGLGLGLIFGISGIAITVYCLTRLTLITYPQPIPHTDMQTVSFETEYSDIVLPVKKLVDNAPNNYHTFYVWTQRMDWVPSLTPTLSAALSKGDLVVMINPVKPFSQATMKSIYDFVAKGGRFLLLDSSGNKKTTSNNLLKLFEMKINFHAIKDSRIFNRNNRYICRSKNAGSVEGGTGYAKTIEGDYVFAVKNIGKGRIGVMADSDLFANPVMGDTQIKPNKTRLEVFSLEFLILGLMGK